MPVNNTLQATITAVYQEEWRQEGEKLMEQSRLALWQGQEANDPDKIAAALELEKQAKVFLGKVKEAVSTGVWAQPHRGLPEGRSH